MIEIFNISYTILFAVGLKRMEAATACLLTAIKNTTHYNIRKGDREYYYP
jgi:hypothetical protein